MLCRVVLIRYMCIKITVGHLVSGGRILEDPFLSLNGSLFITLWYSDIGLLRKHFLKLCAPLLAYVYEENRKQLCRPWLLLGIYVQVQVREKRDLAISEAGCLFKHCWWIPQAALVSICHRQMAVY